MDQIDCNLLQELEKGLPVTREPFSDIGIPLGISESEVLDRLQQLKNEGIIRRFKARIDQRKMGVIANALVAWQIPVDRYEDAGACLALFPGVTHCYERMPVQDLWEYTHYTVHHGVSRQDVTDEVEKIAEMTGLSEYIIIFSTEEFKRVPAVRLGENGG